MRALPSPWLVALAGLTGILAAIASAAGILLRGDLATRQFTTIRGDAVEYLTTVPTGSTGSTWRPRALAGIS